MNPEQSKLAYTIQGAADAISVSDKTIRRAIADGTLVPSYVHSRPLILAVDLLAWLNEAKR